MAGCEFATSLLLKVDIHHPPGELLPDQKSQKTKLLTEFFTKLLTVSKNIVSYFSNLAKNDLAMVTVGAVSVSNEGGDTCNGMHAGKKTHFQGI